MKPLLRTFSPQTVVLSKAQIADLIATEGLSRDDVLKVVDTLDFYGLLVKGGGEEYNA